MFDTLRQDIRYAVRTLGRAPGFTIAAVATLGLGIGATALVFSMANAMLLRPFPYSDPSRLVMVEEADEEWGDEHIATSFPNYLSWRESAKSFENIATFHERSVSLRVGDGAEHIDGALVTANLFATLGIHPVAGRDFVEEEDVPGAPRSVLLSHRLWLRQFNGAASAIGSTVHVNAEPHTVVGVMPPDFAFPMNAEIWVPIRLGETEDRGSRYLNTVARLKDGVTIAQADAEIKQISARLAAEYPGPNSGHVAHVEGFQAGSTRQVRPVILVLLGAVGFVLLIACANVANLMLARASTREREMAIRGAIGAGGARLIRQLLTESLLIALLGGALGLVAGAWWLDMIVSRVPEEMPFWMRFDIDGTVLLFVTAVAVTTSVIFGLAPALQAGRADLQSTLKEGRSSGGTRRTRMRAVFVVSQLAAAIVLLVGALLMVRSFLAMHRVDPGFDRTNIVTMEIVAPPTKYSDPASITAFHDRILSDLAALPGIDKAALVSWFPIGGSTSTSNFSVQGIGEVQDASAFREAVSADYFAAMGIPVLRGRVFDERDRADAPPVVIVNQNFVERFFPDTDPIGRRVVFGGGAPEEEYATVVGVVGNVNERDVNQKEVGLDIYAPMLQSPEAGASLVLRTRASSAQMLNVARERVRKVDADVTVFDARTVEDVISEATWDSRLTSSLFTLFGMAALLLAGIGLYGVIAYSVSQRTHEIGIRVALGASRGDVIQMILAQGLRLTGIGLVIGIAIAFGLSRVLATLLFGVSSTDPWTFVLVPFMLGSVALLATYLPARRATRVNPITALRTE